MEYCLCHKGIICEGWFLFLMPEKDSLFWELFSGIALHMQA